MCNCRIFLINSFPVLPLRPVKFAIAANMVENLSLLQITVGLLVEANLRGKTFKKTN